MKINNAQFSRDSAWCTIAPIGARLALSWRTDTEEFHRAEITWAKITAFHAISLMEQMLLL
jgi:hypothetical protein